MSRGTRPGAYGLDTFGAPSPEEAAAGMPVHGEAPVVRYEVSAIPDGMVWPPLSQKRNCALNGGSGSRLAARSCCRVVVAAQS